ncbi:uncharacterized protein HaLaN_05403 [Haematococcus lacustris]|uniref:Uncharacterized protein n=1 Tax=Haematococcus lacustris TaxID=44745 RepID=A0A699Z3X8_HAELA|nr:uncharacterized protein HaLaN_05403 [Haematococcus lacustris]
MQANGAAHWANNHNYTWHAKKCKMHTLMRGVSAAGFEAGAVVPSEVVEARLYAQLVLWVEACSKRALLASLLLGLMVRDSFTRVTVLADGQELLEELPAVDAPIPDFTERNLFLKLGRGLPPPGIHSAPCAAVENVLIVESVWQRSLSAGQYYRQSGITQHAKTSKPWMAGIQHEHAVLSQVTNYTASLQRYREFRLYGGKQRTVAKFWAETVRGAMVRCNSAATGRPLALAYGAAGFSGAGSMGSRGVPVKQMLREACQQFPGRVLMVDEFRTSRVSSAHTNVVAGHAEGFSRAGPPSRAQQLAGPPSYA